MKLNKMIDHTALKANVRKADIDKLLSEAKEYDFASVCVNTSWVSHCAATLKGTDVMTCCVVGFPLGAMDTKSKAFETATAVENGTDEVDMVLNIGRMLDGDFDYVEADIKAVVDAAKGKTVKVIFETCLLSKEQIKKAAELSVAAGAHFVKTSTGFSTGGATVEDVKLMSDTVAGRAQVKASGGVRTPEDVAKMIEAGATRIGTSSGIKLMAGETVTEGY